MQPQMQPLRSRQPGRHRPSVHRPDSGDIELWRALGVNRGVLGVSAEVMAHCRGGDQACDLVDLLPDLPASRRHGTSATSENRDKPDIQGSATRPRRLPLDQLGKPISGSGTPDHAPSCVSATVCNECGDSCNIRVVAPDLGDADDEPNFCVVNGTQTASTAGRAPRGLSLPPLGAPRRVSLSIVFQEMKASSDVPAPSGL
jgi:hypothetical protein